jgi:hypothetical protein
MRWRPQRIFLFTASYLLPVADLLERSTDNFCRKASKGYPEKGELIVMAISPLLKSRQQPTSNWQIP